ncbi:MAG TPA: hypothetical protein VHB72_04255 [Candidatus Saccharimonadales bacterium]|nr:hypothetical protein [Candidatus Saccharimonadales bacterium]
MGAEEPLGEKGPSLRECLSRQIDEFGPDVIELIGNTCLIEGCKLVVNENGLPEGITHCMQQPRGIY